MSTHCLSCGNKSDGIREENKNTWVIIKVYNDPDYRPPSKHPRAVEEWWIHRACFKNYLLSECGVNTKI